MTYVWTGLVCLLLLLLLTPWRARCSLTLSPRGGWGEAALFWGPFPLPPVPVRISLGDVPALKRTLADNGVAVLSNRFTALERNGDTVVLAGIDDPNGYADQKTPEQLAAEVYAQWGDPFWVLLAHRNDRFASQYSLLGADLVVSGHAHGGIIRLPFTDGLISHDFQLFPSYTAGLYRENGSDLFVTRGLGNSGPSFRLFNRPEVAILTLHKES